MSAYALTKDKRFIIRATEIADRLLPAFNTPSGIPHGLVNLKRFSDIYESELYLNSRSGSAIGHNWASGSILAEFGTMIVEFEYLSYVTGDPKYLQKVHFIINFQLLFLCW